MSASHNPGGPDADFGIKFNYSAGEPAPEKITDRIYGETQKISTLRFAEMPDIDLSKVGVTKFGDFEARRRALGFFGGLVGWVGWGGVWGALRAEEGCKELRTPPFPRRPFLLRPPT